MPGITYSPQLNAIGGWNIGYRPSYCEVTWYTSPVCEVNIKVLGDYGESGGETLWTSESPVTIPLSWFEDDYLLGIRFGIKYNDTDIYITNMRFQ